MYPEVKYAYLHGNLCAQVVIIIYLFLKQIQYTRRAPKNLELSSGGQAPYGTGFPL